MLLGIAGLERDETIPASVDDPAEGTTVAGGPVLVHGWCQLVGGGLVEPYTIELDGLTISGFPIRRVSRPDLATALPQMGETSAAGYEIALPAGLLTKGRHVLVVTFRAGDRYRRYEPRTFSVAGEQVRAR